MRVASLYAESDHSPAASVLFHVKAISGAGAKLDVLPPVCGMSYPNIFCAGVGRNVAHQSARNLARSAVPENGGVIALLGIFDGFRNRQKVGPVVSAGAKRDAVGGEIVGVDRAQTRIVPSVYGRKPAVRQGDQRAFGLELTNLWEPGYVIIEP